MILSMSQQAVLSAVGDIINFAGFDYGIVTTSSFHRSYSWRLPAENWGMLGSLTKINVEGVANRS